MSRFFRKMFIFCILSLSVLEILSRICIDPFYFYTINTYNEKTTKTIRNIYHNDTRHVDYLFIGSSRVPATINPSLFKSMSSGKTVINAGRGYMTEGIHYQALKHSLQDHPNYLKDAAVFIEYSGMGTFTTSFEADKLCVYEPEDRAEKPMPHLLLPYLDLRSLIAFIKESRNSAKVKLEMILLQSALYRSISFVNETFNSLNSKVLFEKETKNLVSEGGIRNDRLESAQMKAISGARDEKQSITKAPPLTFQQLEKSSLAAIHDLVTQNGGTLYLYEMPLHSIQRDIFTSSRALENKAVFENWIKSRNITIIYNPTFYYTDSDFPDTWHLAKDRRDEFTRLLFNSIEKAQSPHRAEKRGRYQNTEHPTPNIE